MEDYIQVFYSNSENVINEAISNMKIISPTTIVFSLNEQESLRIAKTQLQMKSVTTPSAERIPFNIKTLKFSILTSYLTNTEIDYNNNFILKDSNKINYKEFLLDYTPEVI